MSVLQPPSFYMKCKDNASFKVVFCDNHIVVVLKPFGITTQSHTPHEMSAEEWTKNWIKERFHKKGAVFLHAVHRLDKTTEGLVLLARTSKALSRLNACMRERAIRKIYYAIVEGVPKTDEGVLEHELKHGAHRAYLGKKGAKSAVLHYKVVKRGAFRSLLCIELQTGRYHQIRAQLAAIGHPIVGDRKYGSTVDLGEGCIALWHTRLEFVHPVTLEPLSFSYDAPVERWL